MPISIQERELMHSGLTRPLSSILLTNKTYTWVNKPSAADYGVGQVYFSDLRTTGYSDGVNWNIGSGVMLGANTSSNIAIMGDSTAEQNTYKDSTANTLLVQGPVVAAMCYLGWPWTFDYQDNFSLGGTNTSHALNTQLPALLVRHATQRYTRCFISTGTNDTDFVAAKANMLSVFNTLRQHGIIPVHVGIRPRGNDVSTVTSKQQKLDFNQWLYQLSLQGLIEYIDVYSVYADNSTAFGNAILGLTLGDYLHPNSRGAHLEGKVIADYYTARGIGANLKLATSQFDTFNRTYNPGGVVANPINPLLQGGTTAPTGMTTVGGTWSKVNRTLPNGEIRTDASCALAASTTHYIYSGWGGVTGAWGASQLQPGDIIEARAKVTLTSGVNIWGIQQRLAEMDGTTTVQSYCLGSPVAAGIVDGNYTMYLKTPKMTVRPYSGSGNVSVYTRVECITAAGGSGTFNVEAIEMRKVG